MIAANIRIDRHEALECYVKGSFTARLGLNTGFPFEDGNRVISKLLKPSRISKAPIKNDESSKIARLVEDNRCAANLATVFLVLVLQMLLNFVNDHANRLITITLDVNDRAGQVANGKGFGNEV